MSPHISSPTSVGLGMEGLILVIEPSTLTGQGDSFLALSAKFRLGDSPASCGAGGVPACLGLPDGSDWNEAVKPALAVGRDSCESKARCALCSERLVLPFVLAVTSPLADHHGATFYFGSRRLTPATSRAKARLCPTCDGGLVLNVVASVAA